MNTQAIKSVAMLAAAVMVALLTSGVVHADSAGDVESILRDIRQDRPVPKLSYLKRVKSINADSAYYQGLHNGIEVAVETHPNSDLVASVLLKIGGTDRTRDILPAVIRVLGSPHHSDTRKSVYSWAWPAYRAASLHYTGYKSAGADNWTIVSLFYE